MKQSTDTDQMLDRAVAALTSAAQQLDVSATSSTQGVVDAQGALHALDRVGHPLAADDSPGAGDALLDVRAAQVDLLAGQLARQRSMLPTLNHALNELRTATTIEDLADAVPHHAVQLGYDRSMFSWVDDERWVPRSAHAVEGHEFATALVQAGGPPYTHTRDLLEIEAVRHRRAILATDVEGNPRVHQRLWAISHSRTYVAAPVVARGRVAALVHLDRNVESGTTDEFDRDLLAAFCQGVGLMLDHLFWRGSEIGAIPSALSSSWAAALTTREKQVLQLVAAGLTNAEIAGRLYLGDETVKTHLTKLMRKLGVNNRAQAAAVYLRLRLDPPPSAASG